MLTIRQPMLACNKTVEDKDLRAIFRKHKRLYATPKLDGIRCISDESVPTSRSLTPLPNSLLRQWFEDKKIQHGFDGEIIIPGMTFHEIQSRIMTRYTAPFNFEYHVFDMFPTGNILKSVGYLRRTQNMKSYYRFTPRMRMLMPEELKSPDEARRFFRRQIAAGFEGAILRDGDSLYKDWARATWDDGFFKMTQWVTSECIILELIEKQTNENKATKDRRGYTKRSKHKANLVGCGTLGALKVRDVYSNQVFQIGSGWTDAEGQEMWDNPEETVGSVHTYKKKVHGEKDLPRSPIWKGARPELG